MTPGPFVQRLSGILCCRLNQQVLLCRKTYYSELGDVTLPRLPLAPIIQTTDYIIALTINVAYSG